MLQVALWLLWASFILYAFLFAPPNQPDTLNLIQDLISGNWDGINPLVIALFNILGIVPLLYASVMFLDGRGQKAPAWLFASFSFGVGVFSILPYLALRRSNPTFTGQKDWLLKLLDSRITGGFVALGAIGLLIYGITAGDWSNFIQQWQTSRFVHVMSLDFCLLCLLFPVLLPDDMARRGLSDRRIFWAVSLIPLLGPLAYITLRPPIREEKPIEQTAVQV